MTPDEINKAKAEGFVIGGEATRKKIEAHNRSARRRRIWRKIGRAFVCTCFLVAAGLFCFYLVAENYGVAATYGVIALWNWTTMHDMKHQDEKEIQSAVNAATMVASLFGGIMRSVAPADVSPCPVCKGRGRIGDIPCSACDGDGKATDKGEDVPS